MRTRVRATAAKSLSLCLVTALPIFALTLMYPSQVNAQLTSRTRPEAPQQQKQTNVRVSLRDRIGVAVAERLLESSDADSRLRGIERLGAIGTPEAMDKLLESLEQGSPVGRDPKARLEAVRALSSHAKRDGVRQFLTRELTDASASARGAVSPLGEIIRSTAALALARTDDKKALNALINAIGQGGAPGAAAAQALKAYPPASMQLLIGGRKRLTPALISFLGDLGDLRVIERLRPILETGDKSSQLSAALSLAKLGDEVALSRARQWLRKPEPRLLKTAAEVLVYLGAPEASDAVAALLKSETTRLDGLMLAELAPTTRLAPKLVEAIPLLREDLRPRAVAAIGRAGGADAVKHLKALLDSSDLGTASAFALATMPDVEAKAALEALIANPSSEQKKRHLAIRASIVRALVLGDAPESLETQLRALLSSKDAIDRAVSAFGLVALGLVDAEQFVAKCSATTCDAMMIAAAARGAYAVQANAATAFTDLLVRLSAEGADDDVPSSLATAAGIALFDAASSGQIAMSRLAGWAETGGALSPLAARALARRSNESFHGRVERLLEGTDPVVRAHVALGLGHNPEASSVSMLTRAYQFEEDATVRRAIIRGLSCRTEVQRKRTLLLARDLDPDAQVRALARSALKGHVLDRHASPLANGVVWVSVISNDNDAKASNVAARVIRTDGIALPVVTDPDGVLLLPGMPPGPASITLAPMPISHVSNQKSVQ